MFFVTNLLSNKERGQSQLQQISDKDARSTKEMS
jgi:hypothetical protein